MDRRLRIDLTDKLTHWFKPLRGDLRAEFIHALNSLEIAGAQPPYVLGPRACVAFTEVPLAIAAKLLPDASSFGINYAPVGFVVDRAWLFERGARPVIYQREEEAELLPVEQRFRHVTLDFERRIDFTWKREWRVPEASVQIDPRYCSPVVPSFAWLRELRERVSTQAATARLIANTIVLEALV